MGGRDAAAALKESLRALPGDPSSSHGYAAGPSFSHKGRRYEPHSKLAGSHLASTCGAFVGP